MMLCTVCFFSFGHKQRHQHIANNWWEMFFLRLPVDCARMHCAHTNSHITMPCKTPTFRHLRSHDERHAKTSYTHWFNQFSAIPFRFFDSVAVKQCKLHTADFGKHSVLALMWNHGEHKVQLPVGRCTAPKKTNLLAPTTRNSFLVSCLIKVWPNIRSKMTNSRHCTISCQLVDSFRTKISQWWKLWYLRRFWPKTNKLSSIFSAHEILAALSFGRKLFFLNLNAFYRYIMKVDAFRAAIHTISQIAQWQRNKHEMSTLFKCLFDIEPERRKRFAWNRHCQ